MKAFMKVYFKTLDWMAENTEEVVQYCVDMNDENGSSMEPEIVEKYVQADKYYTLDEAVQMMETKAEGSEYSEMESNLMDVLDFFISVGNYMEGDDEKFAGHVDSTLLKEVLDESK
jgi:hypothetical protein